MLLVHRPFGFPHGGSYYYLKQKIVCRLLTCRGIDAAAKKESTDELKSMSSRHMKKSKKRSFDKYLFLSGDRAIATHSFQVGF